MTFPPNDSSLKLRSLTEQLFSRIFPNGVSQLVTTATRISPAGVLSGLDHFYTNQPQKCSTVETSFFGGSDHKMITVSRYTKSEIRQPPSITKRSFKNFSPEDFLKDLSRVSWCELYLEEDPEEAATILTKKMREVLDQHAPIRTFQIWRNYAPWLSVRTKSLMTQGHGKNQNFKKPKMILKHCGQQ